MMPVLTFLGLLGVCCVLLAYGLVTSGRWHAHEQRYQWLNVLGSFGIVLSLLEQWNFPALATNVAWMAIGGYALVKPHRSSKESP